MGGGTHCRFWIRMNESTIVSLLMPLRLSVFLPRCGALVSSLSAAAGVAGRIAIKTLDHLVVPKLRATKCAVCALFYRGVLRPLHLNPGPQEKYQVQSQGNRYIACIIYTCFCIINSVIYPSSSLLSCMPIQYSQPMVSHSSKSRPGGFIYTINLQSDQTLSNQPT